MAKIIDNSLGRRMIRLSADDIFSVIAYYQQNCNESCPSYEDARKILKGNELYLPEDL